MTDSLDTSEREAEDPRETIRLPVREMRDEPQPAAVHVHRYTAWGVLNAEGDLWMVFLDRAEALGYCNSEADLVELTGEHA